MATDIKQQALEKHYEWQGKIEVISRAPVNTREDLSLCYTPGVAQACLEIEKDPSLSYKLTRRKNLVAVITDGTAVLGLGDIGGLAGMPVMEGKCCLFKEFAGVDAFPICIKSKDVDEIVRTIELISDSFGGINIEDISAPRCFEIERRLKEKLDIPVFHDDQHGTAVVVGAALINAVRCAGKQMKDITVVINGAGAAGIAIGTFLLNMGIGNLIMVDINGIINKDDKYENPAHAEIATKTNNNNIKGGLSEAMKGADVFIGVSKPGLVSEAQAACRWTWCAPAARSRPSHRGAGRSARRAWLRESRRCALVARAGRIQGESDARWTADARPACLPVASTPARTCTGRTRRTPTPSNPHPGAAAGTSPAQRRCPQTGHCSWHFILSGENSSPPIVGPFAAGVKYFYCS